ncbi:hypothetical protein CFIMG_005649RA [Ceratocystis fimbriata CBS 114723]|uniref:Uncharacterized protein n=1 Tax=Ceratocystis fimbriata CBS 114723 TaxID=1035309 RepID=A0A2C5WUW4_9PEZI|nr:hypothetical protein CFIMG_005649RA [Ceratocystis fimbriata CBS 114723]
MSTNDIPMAQPLSGARRPDAAAQAKRDRKRKDLADRLDQLQKKFSQDKDLKYRDHLQRVQVDSALVTRMDPYSENALEILEEMRVEHAKTQTTNHPNESTRTLLEMAGPRFQEWAQSISDVHEYRDFQLTKQLHDYKTRIQSSKNTYNYRIETAKREQHCLAKTLRDRLINTLNAKKHRLLKEKEAFEIGDTSALMLHSNQYSFLRPSSPGGNTKRTRTRREQEDILASTNGSSHEKKRKRGADDDGSPAPVKRVLDTTDATPMWQSEKLRLSAKHAGPIYSLEKLFTEKELAMTYNTAATAAHRYMLRHRFGSGEGNESVSDNDDDDAPAMDRQVSHQTRSTRGANPNFSEDRYIGWEAISSFEIPANLDLAHGTEMPKMPPQQPAQYLKANLRSVDSNFPSSLGSEDINSDLQVMKLYKTFDKHHQQGASLLQTGGLRKLLEVAAQPSVQETYVAFAARPRNSNYEALRRELGITDNESAVRGSPSKNTASSNGNGNSNGSGSGSGGAAAKDAISGTRRLKESLSVKGSVSMSRQSSANGVGMSRQGSSRGKGRKN